MKYQIEFGVCLAAPSSATSDARIADSRIFIALRLRFPDASINPTWFQIRADLDDAKASKLFEVVKSAGGKLPVCDLLYAYAHPDTHYPVKITRVPSAEELNNSPLLMLIHPPGILATWVDDLPDGNIAVKGAGRKTKYQFGAADYAGWSFLFKDELKTKLESAGLKGCTFRPVQIVGGKPLPLWQLWPTYVLPPAINEVPLEHAPDKVGLVDGYYQPAMFRLRSSDIPSEGLPDVMRDRSNQTIVSQRFRRLADKLAPGQFKYGLVAIGEGEELRTRYTIPELAPPRDAV